jgi:hypothetical protein
VDEADQHPVRHQRGLGGNHGLEQGQMRVLFLRRSRVVAGDGVIGEAPQQVYVPRGPGVLEAAHAQMAARDPGENGSGLHRLAVHRAARCHHREGPCGGDAQRVHGLAHDVFPQHRAHHGPAVTVTGKRGAPGALQMDVEKAAVDVGNLAEQECPPVAEPGGVPAELVPRIGLRHRGGTEGDCIAGQELQAFGTAQEGGVQAKRGGQRLVQHEQPRVGGVLGLPGKGHFGQVPGEVTVKRDG